MQESGLRGFDVHGFSTSAELEEIVEEAKQRWLDPAEICALLCNPHHFSVRTHRLKSPTSGTIVHFDRGKFRNYRKDGHNWKKGESHEYLRLQGKDRIHVYYAHGLEGLNISRRAYWLVDENKRKLDDIVLVHYLKTREETGVEKDSDSAGCDELLQSTAPTRGEALVDNQSHRTTVCGSRADDEASGANHNGMEETSGPGEYFQHLERFNYLNTCDWEELVKPNDNNSTVPTGDEVLVDYLSNRTAVCGSSDDVMGAWSGEDSSDKIMAAIAWSDEREFAHMESHHL